MVFGCCRHGPWRRLINSGPDDDTETDSGEQEVDLWSWYNDHCRDFDSLHFPPGAFCTGGASASDDSSSQGSEEEEAELPRLRRPGQHCGWDEVDGLGTMVRGPKYLSDRRKVPSESSMLELVHVDLFASGEEAVSYSASSRCSMARRRQEGDGRFFFFLHFRLCPYQLAITWAVPQAAAWLASPEGELFRRFCDMDDHERRRRLKVIPNLVDGPWHVRKSVGNRPAILGAQCTILFFRDSEHLEASVDCLSNALGRSLRKMLTGGYCVLELFVLIEGQAEDELPERILGSVALHRVDLDSLRVR